MPWATDETRKVIEGLVALCLSKVHRNAKQERPHSGDRPQVDTVNSDKSRKKIESKRLRAKCDSSSSQPAASLWLQVKVHLPGPSGLATGSSEVTDFEIKIDQPSLTESLASRCTSAQVPCAKKAPSSCHELLSRMLNFSSMCWWNRPLMSFLLGSHWGKSSSGRTEASESSGNSHETLHQRDLQLDKLRFC